MEYGDPTAGVVFSSYAAAQPTSFGRWAVERLNRLYVELIGAARLRGACVCEIGPGRGLFAERCRQLGAHYIGLDTCSQFVSNLQRRGFDAHLHNVPPIPRLVPSGYDVIFAGGMVEHVPQMQVAELFLSAYDALAENGSFCVVAPDAMAQGTDFWLAHYTHVWPTTRRTLRQAARDAGFQVVRCRRFSLIPGVWRLSRYLPLWSERIETLRLCLGPRLYLEARKGSR